MSFGADKEETDSALKKITPEVVDSILGIVGGVRYESGYLVPKEMAGLFESLLKSAFDDIRKQELKKFYAVLKK